MEKKAKLAREFRSENEDAWLFDNWIWRATRRLILSSAEGAFVMRGLGSSIPLSRLIASSRRPKTWMAGIKPAMTAEKFRLLANTGY